MFPQTLNTLIRLEEDRWILWSPVCFGVGVLGYFVCLKEPPFWMFFCVSLVSLGALILRTQVCSLILRRLLGAFTLIALGFSVSAFHTERVNPHMLVVKKGPLILRATIQHCESLVRADQIVTRLILKNIQGQSALPVRVRVTLKKVDLRLHPGQQVRLTAVLLPVPEAPAPVCAPLHRQAFFQGIGAVGFVIGDVEIQKDRYANGFSVIRHRLTDRLLQGLPPPFGSLACALITGETGSLSPGTRQMFADAGIAHLLAISGLHLSIVAGFVFLGMQWVLVLVPFLRYPVHKIASLLALGFSGIYLALSGAAVPAQRAFSMTAFVMVGVLLDRRVITLRTVAFVATAILVINPSALLTASFQLSFAAVVALVSVYESWGEWIYRKGRYVRFFVSSLVSSIVAGFATMPLGMAFFHKLTLQGILTNLIAIPFMTFIVMPLALVTSFGILLGFESAFLLLWPLKGLLHLARISSTWPGAHIVAPVSVSWGFPLFVGGGLWFCLWRSPVRFGGLFVCLLGFGGMFQADCPDYWMDPEGKVFGFFDRQTKTLWISTPKKFVQTLWSEAVGARSVCLWPPNQRMPGAHGISAHWSGQTLTLFKSTGDTWTTLGPSQASAVGACNLWIDSATYLRFKGTRHPGEGRPWTSVRGEKR